MIETERLILRPWQLSDAEALYEVAKDPRVGTQAGWPPHTSVEESRAIIEAVFMHEGIYAISEKGRDRVIGCVGLVLGEASNFKLPPDEGELAYWLGVPYWGRGYTTEAARALVQHGFSVLGLEKIWAGAFLDNVASIRVQEKCGMTLDHVNDASPWAQSLEEQQKKEAIRCVTRTRWRELA